MPFPGKLKGKYQSFTQADITALREIGYEDDFVDVLQGVSRYMTFLRSANPDRRKHAENSKCLYCCVW